MSLMKRALFRGFSTLLEDLDRMETQITDPYWRHVSDINQLNIGEGLGEPEDTLEKFAVKMDVSHFRPEELKVDLQGYELTIKGNHAERTDKYGSIQRSFVRKYILPEDTNLDSLRSLVSAEGHLCIEATKKNATDGPQQPRAIAIERHLPPS